MAEHPNAQLVRDGYAAFGRGDLEFIRGIFAPDIVWHVGGRSRLARTYKGIDEVFSFFGQIVQETGGTFHNDVHDVVTNDEHVVALVTQSGERSGKKLTVRAAQVLHVSGGKVTESWFLPDDQYAVDDFWG